MCLFQLEAATYAVNHAVLLQPLTLTLPYGRIIGLVGRNGSGKTTLLKLLARQLMPSQGQISFSGVPLSRWKPRLLAQRIGYLPQQVPVAIGMTVREVVSLGRYPWHGPYGRFSHADRAKVEDAMQMTNVHAFADRFVQELSGGERQRAWLAMLVAQESGCLLLDEPLAALDMAHQVDMLRLLRRLATERQTSIVLVLHDINLAAQYCDELVSLRAGHLLAQGSSADLMNGAMLQAIYGIPMGVTAHPETGAPIGFVR